MLKLKILNKPKTLKLKCASMFPDVVLANLQEKTIKSSIEQQIIKADRPYDGLSKVIVEALESETLNITPTLEEQKYIGVYGEVNVEPADEIYKQGNYDERVKFWDAWTDNGKRTDYGYGCYGWYGEAFYPTRDLGGTNMQRMFYMFKELDLAERCKECGIKIDCTKCTNTGYMFGSSEVTGVPHLELNHRNMNKFDGLFNNCPNLKYVEKITFRDDGTQTFLATTFNCSGLEEIRFEGVIGNDITFQSCTLLSKESISSIMNVLSTTTSGKILSLSKTAVNNAFETSDDAGDGSTSNEWNTLVATKNNWTITLI